MVSLFSWGLVDSVQIPQESRIQAQTHFCISDILFYHFMRGGKNSIGIYFRAILLAIRCFGFFIWQCLHFLFIPYTYSTKCQARAWPSCSFRIEAYAFSLHMLQSLMGNQRLRECLLIHGLHISFPSLLSLLFFVL